MVSGVIGACFVNDVRGGERQNWAKLQSSSIRMQAVDLIYFLSKDTSHIWQGPGARRRYLSRSPVVGSAWQRSLEHASSVSHSSTVLTDRDIRWHEPVLVDAAYDLDLAE